MAIESMIEKNEYEQALKFLKKIPGIKNVDLEVLSKACLLKEEHDIKGMISYDKNEQYGLIRYFAIQKQVESNDVLNLFKLLSKKAKDDDVKEFIGVIDNIELGQIFSFLGFIKSDKRVYLEEKLISNNNTHTFIYAIE